eukprot:g994.t1
MPSRRSNKRSSSNEYDGDSKRAKTGGNSRKLKAHKKYKWTPEETVDLVKAVKEFHDGKTFIPFAQILASDVYSFHEERTSLHLGDKWKRLKQQYDGVVADVDALCDHVIAVETQRANEPPVTSLHRRTEKMQRKRWTPEEVEVLIEGHNKHGNKWVTILREYRDKFDAKRTTMDLKDKMRNINGAANKKKNAGSKREKTSLAL